MNEILICNDSHPEITVSSEVNLIINSDSEDGFRSASGEVFYDKDGNKHIVGGE